jgi:hypothetical protein
VFLLSQISYEQSSGKDSTGVCKPSILFQLHKAIAKLKLLQRGLIREAQRIDDFNIRAKKSKNADEDDIADVLEEEQEGSETAEQFMERIGKLSIKPIIKKVLCEKPAAC